MAVKKTKAKAKPAKAKTKKAKKVVKAKKPEKVEKVEKIEKKEVEVKAEEVGKEVGKVRHYFDKIQVAVIDVTDSLKVGDKIRIKGSQTDFEQTVDSMQIDKQVIKEAKKGDAIGMKVTSPVRENDKIYLAK
jgi:putative protease